MGPISVLVVDDHSLVRAGFRSILSGEDDIRVVGDAKDGAGAVAAAVREGAMAVRFVHEFLKEM